VRQGWYSHRVGSLLVLQLMSVFLVVIYENSILKDIILWSPDVVFGSVNEALEANYTYLYFRKKSRKSLDASKWVEDNYNTAARRRTQFIKHCCDDQQLKDLFWKRSDGTKYALNDERMEKQFILERLNVLVGYKYPCYSTAPSESVFSSKSYFTLYVSPVGDEIAGIHRRLQSVGFSKALGDWIQFTRELEVVRLRRKVERYDADWKEEEETNQKRLFRELSRLSYWVSAFKSAGICEIFAFLILLLEICWKYKARIVQLIDLLAGEAENVVNKKLEIFWVTRMQNK